jgi:hypothetical protein
MIQHIVSEIGGVAMLGVISIFLFFAVFGGALIWAFCLKKDFLAQMEVIPLRDEPSEGEAKGANHHE